MTIKKGLYNLTKIICIVLLLAMMCMCSSCAGEKKTIVLTTGFNKDEVFKIEDEVCKLNEALVYLTNITNRYVSIYGPDILKIDNSGLSMEKSLKDNALADISQIKAMDIAAKRYGIKLADELLEKLSEAALEYYSSLNEAEIAYLNVSKEDIYNMYYDYLLADKYYQEVIKEINPEISDDEARTITVQHIFLKTYEVDENGRMVEFDGSKKEELYQKALKIYDMAVSGEYDFEDLVEEYSEGEKRNLSFGMNETDKEFETAAFNLGENEISNVVRTKYGFHIIKCISTFNLEETQANKERIALDRKQEVFGKEYDDYANTLITYMNDELWDSVKVTYNEDVNTQTFFEVYHKYFD